MFAAAYPDLDSEEIAAVWREENEKFLEAPELGLKELVCLESFEAPAAFKLHEPYGFPYEMIQEYKSGTRAIQLTSKAFQEEFKKHRKISRAGQEEKFRRHGLILGTGELKAGNEEELYRVVRVHTRESLPQRS